MPVLLVYGERAFAEACSGRSELHWYSAVCLPEQLEPADEAFVAAALTKLVARAVVIWPARGDAGYRRAGRDAALIAQAGAIAVGIVAAAHGDLETALPHGAPQLARRAAADAALAAAKARTLPPFAGRAARAIPPWMGETALEDVFAEACAFLHRYLAEPQSTIETVALWCLHTWVARSERSNVDVSPRLVLHGLDPRAEHARALRLIAWLVPTPLLVARTIASHVLGAIEADKPTLLLDDVAGGTLYRRDMCTLIAAGAHRDGIFLTARNKRNETGRGQCFAPTAVASGSPLPDDVRLRSIVVPMAPAPAGETRARLTLLEPPNDVLELRAKLQAWACAAPGEPSAFACLPRCLTMAARENWTALMALALKLGPDVAKRTAEAAITLSASAPPARSNLALLRDIRDLGIASGDTRVASSDLLAKLTADPERAWATAYRGRALTSRGLAERLANFGIRPGVMRTSDGVLTRGYRGAAFVDAFARYLGDIASGLDTLEASDA